MTAAAVPVTTYALHALHELYVEFKEAVIETELLNVATGLKIAYNSSQRASTNAGVKQLNVRICVTLPCIINYISHISYTGPPLIPVMSVVKLYFTSWFLSKHVMNRLTVLTSTA